MDELVIADVNAHMTDVIVAGIEAEDVTGLQLVRLHMHAVAGLVAGHPVQCVAKLLIHVVYKAGAVKTGLRGLAAPAIVIAYELQGILRNLPALHAAAGIGADRVGKAAFLHILGVDIAGCAIIGHGGPVAAGAGNGDHVAVEQLTKNLGTGGSPGAHTHVIAGNVTCRLDGGKNRRLGGLRRGLRISKTGQRSPGLTGQGHILGEHISAGAVDGAGGPVAGSAGSGESGALVIGVNNGIAGRRAGAEAHVVGIDIACCAALGRRLSRRGRLHRSNGRHRGLHRSRGCGGSGSLHRGRRVRRQGEQTNVVIQRWQGNKAVTAREVGIDAAQGAAKLHGDGAAIGVRSGERGTEILGVNETGLSIDDAGGPVAGSAGDGDGFAPVVFSQDRRRGRGTAAKTHIHRVYVLTAAAAGHAAVIILRDVQIGGGHEAALTVIVYRIPGAAGTIRHRYGVAPDEAVHNPVIGTGTGAEIYLAAGDNGGFRKSGDAEADAHKPGGKQGP